MSNWRKALITAGTTFLLSIIFNLISNSLLTVFPLILSFVVLFLVVSVGVAADIVGVAAAAARETPFHAMASNRLIGAPQAIRLVRNADRVAAFFSDVIGDIAGTLSGAITAAIIFRVLLLKPSLNETFLSVVSVSIVAALTVGGKAYGKSIAISRATEIIYLVGRAIYLLEAIGFRFRLDKSLAEEDTRRKGRRE